MERRVGVAKERHHPDRRLLGRIVDDGADRGRARLGIRSDPSLRCATANRI
jgi:hypothetical protein